MIIGIDEVGRGCWAGPLVAAAVEFGVVIPSDLKDSKVLSRKKRIILNEQIFTTAVQLNVGWVWPHEINTLGLTASVRLAMRRSLTRLNLTNVTSIIIDGSVNYLSDIEKTTAIVKADTKIAEVSAASIVAKVARDNYMINEMARKYPLYGFEKHVGYGTKLHVKALQSHGVIKELHRLNYAPVKKLL